MLEAERLAGPAEAGEDLVGDQQRALAVAGLAHHRPVLGRRDQDAVGAGHRLEDERGDGRRALPSSCIELAEVAGALAVAGRELLAERAPVAVAVEGVDHAGHAGLERHPAPVAGQRHRAEGGAVVAAIAADDLAPAGDQAGQLDRVLVGLGAAQGEEHLGEALGRHRQQALGQLDLGREHRGRRRDAQLIGLALDRVDDPAVAVAEAGLVAERAEVEPAGAAGGLEPGAVAAGDLDRARGASARSR